MATRIAEIVDYTAALAAGITGVAAVFGSGASSTTDPLRPGQTISPAPGAPAQEFEHWSEVGSIASTEWFTQDGAMKVTWTIPMRLWLTRADLGRLRQVAQPFFALYLTAFMDDLTLGDTCLLSRISRAEIGDDPPRAPGQARWGFLDVTLEVEEIVDP